uniref:non-specific serine/threonine protein kinase n=1 Tax=Aureoumbra lagunensis TaxID=44058 RepID=A0A7S3K0F3_9STRA
MGQCLSGVTFKHERSISSHSRSTRGNMLRQRVGQDVEKYYDILGTIGRGSIGNVCRCRHRESGRVYALKTIKTSRMSKEMVDELMNEVEILMSLDHPNIVKPIELFSRRREIYFIMVLCTGGDLYKRAPYTENEAARIVAMVTDVIDYMHAYKVVHRDIKFENVLFFSKAYDAEIMVIDFGLSKANYTVKREGKLDEFVGTLYSMAPEVIRGSYDEKCDVWSLGVITYMLLAGAMPFTRFDDERKFLRDLEAQRYDMHRRPIAKRSDDAKNFVRSLLIANPAKRPSAAKVKKHPWIIHRRRSIQQADKSGTTSAASSFGIPSPNLSEAPLSSSSEQNYNEREDSIMHNNMYNSQDNLIADALSKYATSTKLRRIALMVVAHRSDCDALREIREAFRAIDTHNEGFITFDELKVVLERAHFDHENVRAIFDAVDHDGTGRISYTEFIAACLEGSSLVQEDQLAEAFDRLDADESGSISRENLRDILGNQFTPQLVDEILSEVDMLNNNGGEISKETFMSLMRGKRQKRIKEKDEGSKIASDASKPKPRKSAKPPSVLKEESIH